MKCWGSFGTGYCCGCIGVFWLSIKANVYVQYQKETRTSKIWISTTPRHQASVGKKISTSNQNLKIFFFQGESEIFGTLQCTVVTWKTTLLLVIVSALHLYLYFSYLYLWVGVFLGSLGAPPLPTEKLLICTCICVFLTCICLFRICICRSVFSWVRCAPLPSPLRNCWSQESTVWTHHLLKGSLKTDHWEFKKFKIGIFWSEKVGSRPFGNIQYRINLVIAIQTSILKNLSMRVFSQSHLKSIWEKTEYLRFKFRISCILTKSRSLLAAISVRLKCPCETDMMGSEPKYCRAIKMDIWSRIICDVILLFFYLYLYLSKLIWWAAGKNISALLALKWI